MKMTIKRKVKCTNCVRYEDNEYDCYWPVPTYIPVEQRERWMKLYHEKMVRCQHHLTQERLRKELLALED
jgi:hypothetical protein